MDNKKVVVVGDFAVGKTCLLMAYALSAFPSEYVPNVFDTWEASLMVDGKALRLGLWDTAGREDYDKMRPLSYSQTSIFIICFSTIFPKTLASVRSKWIPELRYYVPKVPFILCGTKIDLREDPITLEKLKNRNEAPISYEDGMKAAQEFGAACYVECSSLIQTGVHSVFEEAARFGVIPPVTPPTTVGKKTRGGCILS